MKEDRDAQLAKLAERVILSLSSVAEAAHRELEVRGVLPNPASVFASGANDIARGSRHSGAARVGAAQTANTESLRRLTFSPFVARVVAEDEDGNAGVYYVARTAGPRRENLSELDGELAGYYAPLGRLAEGRPGDEVVIRRPGSTELVLRIIERTILDPEHGATGWDGLHDQIEGPFFVGQLASLRAFIERVSASDAPEDRVGAIEAREKAAREVQEGLRRRTIDRMSLRDRAVLDRYQGEVFRLPLGRRLMLSGPPGTGKTTTLIKRVAYKTRLEGLSEEDSELVPENRREEVFREKNWVMFTPTELLRLYLKQAFNEEGVAAPDDRIRTWTEERRRLGREVFRILKSATGGRFMLQEDRRVVASDDATALKSLADAFAASFERQVVALYEKHLDGLASSEDPELTLLAGKLRGRAGGPVLEFAKLFDLIDLHDELASRELALDKATSATLKEILNGLLNRERDLLERIAAVLDREVDDAYPDDEDDDVEPEMVLRPMSRDLQAKVLRDLSLALQARAKELSDGLGRTKTGARSRIIAMLGNALPSRADLQTLGARLLVLEHLRFLGRTHRNLVDHVPTAYQRFRRASLDDGARYLPAEARAAASRSVVTGHELDVMLLVMLRNGTRFFTRVNMRALRIGVDSRFATLNSLRGEYVTQVLVDEATDFSPVQLACMKELARPEFRSFFACGDVRQRVTPWGISDLEHLRWVTPDIDVRTVGIGYRQSRRLTALADDLAAIGGAPLSQAAPPPHVEDADVPAVLGENLAGPVLARWLAARIREVERALGKLPSTAIFVDGDGLLDPLVGELGPLLEEHNLEVVACKEGRVVGTENHVRAFDVQHIKGLEFEAVFFVGMDELASRSPALFDRYLYVGATRAATYLAMTCAGSLPEKLEPLRHHFRTGGWE